MEFIEEEGNGSDERESEWRVQGSMKASSRNRMKKDAACSGGTDSEAREGEEKVGLLNVVVNIRGGGGGE